jgi:hypothetical protein
MTHNLAIMFISIFGILAIVSGLMIVVKSFLIWFMGEPHVKEEQGIEFINEMVSWNSSSRILGIKPDDALNREVVKKAYRKMAMKHHPDHGGSAEQFNKIKQAYDHLIA